MTYDITNNDPDRPMYKDAETERLLHWVRRTAFYNLKEGGVLEGKDIATQRYLMEVEQAEILAGLADRMRTQLEMAGVVL
jgi:hypothetical protein